jgi:hypothetical protein
MARAALALSLLSLAAARGRDHLVEASVHEATGLLTGLSFSERMFADGRGPWGEVAGRASVAVNATLRALRDDEVADAITVHRLRDYFDVGVAVASFTVDARVDGLNASSICAANFSTANTPGLLYGEFHEVDDEHELQIGTAFHPSAAGIQQVLIVPCWKQKSESLGYYPVSADQFSTYPMADALLFMNATVSFRNSYGFLPALLAGLYPFKYVDSSMLSAYHWTDSLTLLICWWLEQRSARPALRRGERVLLRHHLSPPRERNRDALLRRHRLVPVDR